MIVLKSTTVRKAAPMPSESMSNPETNFADILDPTKKKKVPPTGVQAGTEQQVKVVPPMASDTTPLIAGVPVNQASF